jgi:hypothetical protein
VFIVSEKLKEGWPMYLWGMHLGRIVGDIRNGSIYNSKGEINALEKIGFSFNLKKRYSYDDVKIALDRYKELNSGSITVPLKYQIPLICTDYPDNTKGMYLGSIIRRIRQGDKWLDKREELLS